MGSFVDVQFGCLSSQAAGSVAALGQSPSASAPPLDRAKQPFSDPGRPEPMAQFGVSGSESGVWAIAPRLAGALWLPRAGGGNLRGPATVSGNLLQSRRVGSLRNHSRQWTPLAGLLHRLSPSQGTVGPGAGFDGLGATAGAGVAVGVE